MANLVGVKVKTYDWQLKTNSSYRPEYQELIRPKFIDQATKRIQASKKEIRNKGNERAA